MAQGKEGRLDGTELFRRGLLVVRVSRLAGRLTII
jgi:hypothetical protein